VRRRGGRGGGGGGGGGGRTDSGKFSPHLCLCRRFFCGRMGAGALTICQNKAAVQVKEDMKRIVQIPILRPRTVAAKHTKLFGVSLLELREKGLVEDGVPLVVRRMVEHLRKYALQQEGLFRVNGNVRAMETLRQRLECGEEVDLLSESDTCTVASLLKRYLRDLPEGLVDSTVQQALIEHYQECGDDGSWSDVRDLLRQLPDVHHSLLRYLCHFLTVVERNHKDNRMTALNLATVFGPSVFHVAPGFEAMKDQNICNKIMVKLIQNYSNVFETDKEKEGCTEELSSLIVVKEARVTDADTKTSPSHLNAKTPTPVPRTKVGQSNLTENAEHLSKSSTNTPKARPRKKKVRKGKSDSTPEGVPQPSRSSHLPHARPVSIPIVLPLTSEMRSPSPEAMETTPIPQTRQDTPDIASHHSHLSVSPSGSMEALSSSQEEERPISPFYMSNHLSPVHCRPDVVNILDRTIRSAVEQHLFDINPVEGQSSEDCELTLHLPSPKVTPTARQRRRHHREQQEEGLRHRERNRAASIRADTNKENIPLSSGSSGSSGSRSGSIEEDTGSSSLDSQGGQSGHTEQTPKPRKSKHSPTLVQLTDNQDVHTVSHCTFSFQLLLCLCFVLCKGWQRLSVALLYYCILVKECVAERSRENHMDTFQKGNDISSKDDLPSPPQLRLQLRHQHTVPLSRHLEPAWRRSERRLVQQALSWSSVPGYNMRITQT
ncbi:hypothetical protein INR49_016991, partial [Caranx melampygus]